MQWADELDRAAELQQSMNDEAVLKVQRAAAPQQRQNPDGSWPQTECADCGEDIEPARLAHGRVRCYECQSTLERAQSRRRR
jgi:RNA polymerase-binding transcription factor DksA